MHNALLASSTKLFRSTRNAHRYFYFLNNRVYSFVTTAGSIGKQLAAMFGALNIVLMGFTPAMALDSNALPTGYQSVSGNVQFNQAGNQLNVSTGANQSVANYQTFNVGSNAVVNFDLPSASSRILNRVVGGNLSEIYGSINSNGQVFLVNPAGVFFANGSTMSVGNLVASTLNIADNDFLGGSLRFSGSNPEGITVENGATINATNGASFVSGSFVNDGLITAPSGAVQVAVGERVTLNDNLVGFTIDDGLKSALSGAAIQNNGTMSGESVLLSARTVADATKAVIVNTGHVRASKAVTGEGGSIELVADSGVVRSSGTLDASGSEGGKINVLGDYVALSNGSVTDASGTHGGGEINIGGGFQGSDASLRNAKQTYVASGAEVKADAVETGDGGKVVVWSDEATRFYGDISAKGGANSGNGGFVEVSGKQSLEFEGIVNTTAANGETGTLLLDPLDLTVIDGASGTTLNDVDAFSDTPAVNTNISVSTINASGSNVILRANRDLIFNNNAIDVNLTGTKSFTGEAGRDILMQNNTGIRANGGITFNAGRHITLGTNADLVTSGTAINLNAGQAVGPSGGGVGSISITGNNSDIVTNGGNLSMLAPDSITLGAMIITNGGNVNIQNTSSGNVAASNTASFSLGSGNLTVDTVDTFDMQGSVGSSNNIEITADRFHLRPSGLLDATGTVTIKPKVAKAISVGASDNVGTADTAGAGGILNISAQELARITANSVVIGDTALGGGLSAQGTVNMTGFTGGGYNLTLQNAGAVNYTGTYTTNSNDLSLVSSGASVNLNSGSAIAGLGTITALAQTGVTQAAANTLTADVVDLSATTGDISLAGATTGTTEVALTAVAGNISTTGRVQGGALNATVSGAGNTINIADADFTTADLTSNGGNITYNDADGVTIVANTGSPTAGTVSIVTGAPGLLSNNGVLETGLILGSGITQGQTINLTATTGQIAQFPGSKLQGVNLVTNTLASGATQLFTDTDFTNATLTSLNGNITLFDKDGVTPAATTGTGIFTLTPYAPGLLSDNGIMEGNIVINGSGDLLNLTFVDGITVDISGDYNRYYFAASGTGTGLVVNASDTDGVFTQADLKLGTYNLTTHTTGVNTNGIVETDLVIEGTGITAANVNLTANASNIEQSAGAVNVTGDFIAQTNAAGATINLNNVDATTAVLTSNAGNITFNDADGVTMTATTGSTTAGVVSVTSFATGATANNANAEANLNLTGNNSAQTYNLTANSGNIDEIGTTLQGVNLNVTNAALGGTIDIHDADYTNVSLTTNAGDITYKDADGASVVANSAATTGTTVTLETHAAGLSSDNTNAESGLALATGTTQAGTVNLTANAGNISQAVGSTLQGATLAASTTAAAATTNLSNTDFTTATLSSNAGNITLKDKDGVTFTANTGATTGTTLDVTTFDLAATANNGVGIPTEGNLTLATGTTQAGTVNLTANGGIILQNAGSVLQGTSLNASNFGAGGQVLITNADFGSASLSNTNGSNITYVDKDGVSIVANNASNTAGTISVTTHSAAVTADNAVVETDLTLASGTTRGGTVNLTANAGNISQAAGSTVQGTTLNAQTVAAGATINLPDTDFASASLTTNAGNITLKDTDGVSVLANAGSTNANTVDIETNAAALTATNANAETGLTLANGVTQAGTVNLKSNAGNINQAVGSTLQGTTLAATTTAAGAAVNLTDADFNSATLASNNGNITYTDRDAISVNFNAGSGTANITANGAGVVSNNGLAEGNDLTITGTNAAANVTLTAGAGNITQAAASQLTGANLAFSSDGSVSLGQGTANLDFATYTASSVGVGNSFVISDTDNFQILGVTAPNTNFSITAAKSGSNVNLNGNPLAPAVPETLMQVDGAITAANTNLLGRQGAIQLNNNITAAGTLDVATQAASGSITQATGTTLTATGPVQVLTSGNNADIIQAAASTLQSTGSSVLLRTTNTNADITTNGAVAANTSATLRTTGNNGDINVNGGLSSGAAGTTIQTTNTNAGITLNTLANLSSTGATTVQTSGTNADINVADGSITSSTGLITVTTGGNASSIDINGDMASTANSVAVSATGGSLIFGASPISQGVNSLVQGNTGVSYSTSGINGTISLNGQSIADTGNVTVATTGLLGSVVNINGMLDALVGNTSITTTGATSGINLQSASTVNAGSNVTVSATGVNSDIIQSAGSTIVADAGNVSISTGVLNVDGDITLGGSTDATAGSVTISTASLNSGITLQGTSTVDGGTGVSLTTTGINGDITQAAGSVITADTGNVAIATTGALNIDADISLAGTSRALTGNVNVSTEAANSDIALASTSVVTANEQVNISTTGANADVTQSAGSVATARRELSVTTVGNDSDVTIDGNLTSSTRSVLLDTQGTDADITQGATSAIQGRRAVTLHTQGDTADITTNGSLTSTNNIVDIHTHGADANVDLANGSVTAQQNVLVETFGTDSDINIANTVTSLNNNVLVNTNSADSDITLASTALLTADNNVRLETFGPTSNIMVDGSAASSNFGDVVVRTNDATSDITQNNTSTMGGLTTTAVRYRAAGSGNITLDGTSVALERVSARVEGSTGNLAIQDEAILVSHPATGHVDLKSDHMTFQAGNQLSADLVQFAAENATTTIGVGGGAGTLQLTQTAFDGISANDIFIGDALTDTTITLNQLDLSAVPSDLTFNTLNEVQESTPLNDFGVDAINLFMASGNDVYFTGGATNAADRLTSTGIKAVGNNTTVFGDIDVDLPGTSLAYVKLPDGVFSGKAIRIITPGGSAFVNVPDDDDGRLRNLAAALVGRRSFKITNEATPAMLLYMLSLAGQGGSPNQPETGGESAVPSLPLDGLESPATLFFTQAGLTPPSDGPQVLDFSDSVNPMSAGSMGLPSTSTGVSPLNGF